jgi:hypothetical protein
MVQVWDTHAGNGMNLTVADCSILERQLVERLVDARDILLEIALKN